MKRRKENYLDGIDKNLEKTIDYYYIRSKEARSHLSFDEPTKLPIKMIREAGKTVFRCEDRERNIHVEYPSIDEVLIEVDNIIKNRADIKWEPKLSITMKSVVITKPPKKIDQHHPNRLINIGFEFKVVPLEVGPDENGDRWERVQGSKFIRSEIPRKGFIKHWKDEPEDDFHDKDESNVLIDDTPENRIAIQNLAMAFEAFHEKVYGILEPDQIEATISRLIENSGFLLPAKGESGKKKGAK